MQPCQANAATHACIASGRVLSHPLYGYTRTVINVLVLFDASLCIYVFVLNIYTVCFVVVYSSFQGVWRMPRPLRNLGKLAS